jgi:hypothetical protein
VIYRREQSAAQQIGQLSSVDAIVLVSHFQQRIFPWVAYQYFGDMRLEQVVQPGRAGPFFQAHLHASSQSLNELQDGRRFRLQDALHQQMPTRIQNRCGDRCLVHIQTNILGVIHRGAPSGWC